MTRYRPATKYRRIGLAALGCGAIQRGAAYLVPDARPNTGALSVLTAGGSLPRWIVASVWLASGAIAIASAVTASHMRTAGNIAGGVLLTWALAYLISWAIGTEPGGWHTAGVYGWFAVCVMAWSHLVDPVTPGGD